MICLNGELSIEDILRLIMARKYRCDHCKEQIMSKRLNEHIKSLHGNEKPSQC